MNVFKHTPMMYTVFFLFYCILCSSYVLSQINSPGAISSFLPGGQYIMLTFSGGPHALFTPQILDILKEKKARASFFVVGNRALDHPELLKRMHNEKHTVGNHGWTHQPILKLDTGVISKHIQATNNIITNATGQAVKVFRPHNGLTNIQLTSQIKDNEKLKVVLWSLDSKDTQEKDEKKIIDNVLTRAKVGDVVLLHDTSELTVKALPQLIDGLYGQGYELLTLHEVLSYPDDSPHR